jgi:hypothetical protein
MIFKKTIYYKNRTIDSCLDMRSGKWMAITTDGWSNSTPFVHRIRDFLGEPFRMKSYHSSGCDRDEAIGNVKRMIHEE